LNTDIKNSKNEPILNSSLSEGLKEKIIEVQQLTKQFGTFTAVKSISFEVYKGEIFGFLGG